MKESNFYLGHLSNMLLHCFEHNSRKLQKSIHLCIFEMQKEILNCMTGTNRMEQLLYELELLAINLNLFMH